MSNSLFFTIHPERARDLYVQLDQKKRRNTDNLNLLYEGHVAVAIYSGVPANIMKGMPFRMMTRV